MKRSLALGWAAFAAAAALGLAVLALQAWRIDWYVPLNIGGDALLHLGYVQNMVDSGWYLEGPRLGAPFGQEHHDYPIGFDNLHLAILRVLVELTGEAPTSVTLFYLLTFPLAALSTFWAMSKLRVPAPVAVVGAVVFALLPFHFLRNTGHLFLAAYYTVPLSCYLVIATLEGQRFFGLRQRWASLSTTRRVVELGVPAVLAFLIASGGAYYAVFTIVLLVAATAIGWLRTRSRRLALSGLALCALITAFAGLNSLPTLLYRLDHGPNADVPSRAETETELHGLRPVTLILPIEGHRVGPLASLARRYDNFPTTGEHGESLGAVGAIGLVGLLVVGLGAMTGTFARGRRWARHRAVATLTVMSILLAVTGGGSSVIALLVTGQLRAWSRISIFIGFFAVLAVCLFLGYLWRRQRADRKRALMAVALIGLVAVAALDQTSDRFIPAYDAVRAQYASEREFAQHVEQLLPQGAAIYQLPYRPYLEGGPREASGDYEPLRGYVQSRALRWSYGGMKGREAGWQLYAYGRPPAQALPIVALAGFSALWVDRLAYADRGGATEAEIATILGLDPIVSPDQRFAVFDLRPYAEAQRGTSGDRGLAAQRSLLEPVWIRWRSGVDRGHLEGDVVVRHATASAVLNLANDGPSGREQVVSFHVATAPGPPSPLEVRWPDGALDVLHVTDAGLLVERTVTLAAGDNLVELATEAPELGISGPDVLRLRITDLWSIDPRLLQVPGRQ
jgi:phosphoglycerol transferase